MKFKHTIAGEDDGNDGAEETTRLEWELRMDEVGGVNMMARRPGEPWLHVCCVYPNGELHTLSSAQLFLGIQYPRHL